ncbi:hypothetical protein [Fodinicola feengrottensis]|nr:hypothetical protein [Fodinicola feengrottensis]
MEICTGVEMSHSAGHAQRRRRGLLVGIVAGLITISLLLCGGGFVMTQWIAQRKSNGPVTNRPNKSTGIANPTSVNVPPSGPSHEVTYQVTTGKAGAGLLNKVTYTDGNGQARAIAQVYTSPWAITEDISVSVTRHVSLYAHSDPASGKDLLTTCTISVDGRKVVTKSAKTAVTCDAVLP